MNHRSSPLVHVLVLAVLAGAMALCAVPAAAARWDTWNNANALNSVTAAQGVVWCASDLGLHRYDPQAGTFTRIPKTNGQLAANAVSEVEYDEDGRAWFGTKGRGVTVLTPSGSWRTLTTFDGVPSDTILCLEPSPLGMWVGTNKGLALFNGFELTAVWPDGIDPSPFAANDILDIAHVGDSTWVGTSQGPYVTKSDEGIRWFARRAGLAGNRTRSLTSRGTEVWCVAASRVYRGGETGTWTLSEEGLPATTSYSIRANGDTLLLGTAVGVYIRIGAADWQPLGAGYPSAAYVDFAVDGGIWAGNGEGLWNWDGAGWRWKVSPGPGGNRVNGLALEGSKPWITTLYDGVSTFDGTNWKTYRGTVGADPDTSLLSSDFLFGMFVDKLGRKWIGDWGGAISRLDDSGPIPSFTHYYEVAEGAFDAHNTFGWSTGQDPFGNVWVGLDTDHFGTLPPPNGLHRFTPSDARTTFNPQTGTTSMRFSHVRAVSFAPGGSFEMWVGYAVGGIDIFTDPTMATRSGSLVYVEGEAGIPSDDLWAIEFNGDSVWVGTSSGLTRFSRATRGWRETILTESPTTGGAVHPLAIDTEGGVWWATKAGIYHRRPNRSVELITEENSPLLSNDVRSIQVDRATGDIWIATVSGVNRYNPNITVPLPGAGLPTFTTYPNPAYLSSTGVRLFGNGIVGPYTGRVYDVRGRVVRELIGNASVGGLWNATDVEGNRVAPGIYFLAVTQDGVTRTSRVLLVR